MRLRNRHPSEWKKGSVVNKRDGLGFTRMGLYLYHQKRALVEEQYITALFGCRTTWPEIEAMSIYFNVEHKT